MPGLLDFNMFPDAAGSNYQQANPAQPQDFASMIAQFTQPNAQPQTIGGLSNPLQGVTQQPGLSTAQKFQTGADIASTLLNGILGFQQYGLAKDQLDFSKEAFNANYGAQRQQYNTRLAGKYAARQSANPELKQSLEDYMSQNGIK